MWQVVGGWVETGAWRKQSAEAGYEPEHARPASACLLQTNTDLMMDGPCLRD